MSVPSPCPTPTVADFLRHGWDHDAAVELAEHAKRLADEQRRREVRDDEHDPFDRY